MSVNSIVTVPTGGELISDDSNGTGSNPRRLSALGLTRARQGWDGGLGRVGSPFSIGQGMTRYGNAARLWALLLATSATLLVPAAARATPTWLSAINLSDAGQDGFDPHVAVNSNGDSLVVW